MENKKKRKRTIAIVLSCIIVPFGAFGFGYFFGGGKIENKTVGNTLIVDGKIGGTIISKDLETVGLVPGDSVDETIVIEPNCTTPSLLRVKVEPFWSGSTGDTKDDSNIDINFDNNILYKLEEKENPYWYKHSDGYLYYIGIINDSEKINLVKGYSLVAGDNVNDYQGKEIKINVKLDIVQAKHGGYNEKWNVENVELKEKLNQLCDSITATQ